MQLRLFEISFCLFWFVKFGDNLAQLKAKSDTSGNWFVLQTYLEDTELGPLFIISSYQYDNYLSRLKSSFDSEHEQQDINFPKGSGHDRGEIDIMIIEKRRIIFIQVSCTLLY